VEKTKNKKTNLKINVERNRGDKTPSGRTEEIEVQMNTAQKSGMLCKGREWKYKVRERKSRKRNVL